MSKMVGLVWILALYATFVYCEHNQEQEGRIYNGAPVKSIVTLHPSFERTLFALRGCYLKVLPSQIADDIHRNDSSMFIWNINRMTLESIHETNRALGNFYQFGLGAYCPNGTYSFWIVTVRVSEQNKMPPEFAKKRYTFRVPYSAQSGYTLGKVTAEDKDIIVYNSKLHYRLMMMGVNEDFDIDEQTGEVIISRDMKDIDMKEFGGTLVVEACDYGSPQKCASAEIEIIPYFLTSPTNVRILTANPKYQITCWDAPAVGSPDIYIIRIINEMVDAVRPQYKMDWKSSKSKTECAITHEKRKIGETISMLISAKTTDDQSTSDPVQFTISEELKCEGNCFNKGSPYCVNSTEGPVQAEWNGEKYCICEMTYEGPSCAKIKKCGEENILTPFGTVHWESTPVGVKVTLECPYGPLGQYLQRYCWFDVLSQKAEWAPLEEQEHDSCNTKSYIIDHLGSSSLAISENKSTSLKTVKLFTERLEKLLDSALLDFEVARAVFDLADHLASSSPLKLPENVDLSLRLRKLFTKYAEKVVLPKNQKNKILKSKNVLLTIVNVDKESDISSTIAGKEVSLRVPMSVLDQARDFKGKDKASSVQVIFITFKNHNFHQSNDYRAQRSNPVLELFVRGVNQDASLNELISFAFNLGSNNNGYKKENQKRYTCVFWDDKTNKWSQEGLSTVIDENSNGLIKCQTTHLTGFSILLDFERKMDVDDDNRFLLNLLSWIGCSLSIIGLFLTMCTYAVFKYLNREKAGKILLNLCAAMLLLNVVFILSSLRPFINYTYELCISVGVLLHYSTLATLLWMGVEAANMYHMLVHVFATHERHFLLKRCLIAWGLPVIVVGITAGVGQTYYYDPDDKYCRLSPLNAAVHYGAFVGPACLVLVCNCIVFAFVLRVLSLSSDTKKPAISPQTQSTKATSLSSQVRGALTVMVLLGITWVFGAFAVGPARLPFMYVFCLLNSSQGFIIFLVRCLLYEETRSAWLVFFRTGKIKKFRGKAFGAGTRSSDLQSTTSEGKMNRPQNLKSPNYAKRAPFNKKGHPKNVPNVIATSPPNETLPLLTKTDPDRCFEKSDPVPNSAHDPDDVAQYLKYIDEPLTPVKSPSCP